MPPSPHRNKICNYLLHFCFIFILQWSSWRALQLMHAEPPGVQKFRIIHVNIYYKLCTHVLHIVSYVRQKTLLFILLFLHKNKKDYISLFFTPMNYFSQTVPFRICLRMDVQSYLQFLPSPHVHRPDEPRGGVGHRGYREYEEGK